MEWITRAKKFFEVQEVTSKEKIKLAFISMEGGVNHWFQFWKIKTNNPTWEELTQELIRRFGRKERSSVFEKLTSIK